MRANTVTEASSAAPSDSANPSPMHSEDESTGSNTVAVNVVAGSSASTDPFPAPGKEVAVGSGSSKPQTSPTGTPPKPPSRPSMLYDPQNSLAVARNALTRARGNSHAGVVATSAGVVRWMTALTTRTDELRRAERSEEDAIQAAQTAALAVDEALAPAVWKLRKRIHGGADLVDACRKRDAVSTARELLRRMALQKVPLDGHLVAGIHEALSGMQKPEQVLAAAKTRLGDARKAFVSARRALDASVPLLNASLLQARVEARAALVLAQQAAAARTHPKKGG